ncbi:MAG: hypothetical protein HY692_01420, partial [Cyanobacteria bacterium NC_groundwater_1444_Ag_S-0.65um_54_12]|nr:hypothetical protein [Cyanobacteria bacterium NC_groundwater_1444_Ag_S-0.65um_54_12]
MMHALRMACCAALVLLVIACRFPLLSKPLAASSGPQATAAANEPARQAGLLLEVAKPEPLASMPPTSSLASAQRIMAGELESPVPEYLADRPYGQANITIKWPERPQRYRTQAIPLSANSLRLRLIGSDGKTRLSIFFFRPDFNQSLTQSQRVFLPTEVGCLVEIRAYQEKETDLASASVQPPFNPRKPFYPVNLYDYEVGNKYVLAEGFQYNVQISPLAKTAIKVTLDGSQLVAGIGGSPGFSYGGDPYYNNYLSPARYAELWDPNYLAYDRQRDRLFFVEYPSFKYIIPAERDVVQLLTASALRGTADNPLDPQAIMHVVGGDKTWENAIGEGNIPAFSLLTGVSRLAWHEGSGGKDYLFVTEASTSTRPAVVRKVSAASESGMVTTVPLLDGTSNAPTQLRAAVPVLNDYYEIMAIDGAARTVLSNSWFTNRVLAGQTRTATLSTTASVLASEATLSDPRAIAASSSSEFLLVESNSVVRYQDGLMRIIGGTGLTIPIDGLELPATQLAVADLRDVVHDPKDTKYAYLADSTNRAVYRLTLPATLNEVTQAKVIKIRNASGFLSPIALAVSPVGSTLYVLDRSGLVASYDTTNSATASITIVAGANSLACGKTTIPGSGTVDQLFLGSWANVLTGDVVNKRFSSLFNGGELGFTVIKADLAVGDGASLNNLIINGRPSGGGFFGIANLTKPTATAIDSKTGNLYIADTGNNRIRRVTMEGSNSQQIVSIIRSDPYSSPPLVVVNQPKGLDVDEFGNVFIANTGDNLIQVWRPCAGIENSGQFLIRVAGTSTQGLNFDNINARLVQLSAPTALRVEKSAGGNPSRRRIFFIDQGNRVRMLTPVKPDITAPQLAGCGSDDYFDYIISTVVGDGKAEDGPNASQAALASPIGLEIDKNGYIYIADGSKIRRVDSVTGSISTIYTA